MIRVRELTKLRAGEPALSKVDLTVERGSVAALIGESGSGKTTLLRCLNGLEAFDSGTVECFGATLSGGERPSRARLTALRREVGMVFQGYHLFPHLDVIGNLTLAPKTVAPEAADALEARARELLTRFGLADKARSHPHALSGGQQQRVAIARALMMRPKALLLDEPTSALDLRSAADVLALIRELASEGQTLLLSTHALAFARKACAVVHVMSNGRRVESGPPEQVLVEPTHEATRRLLAVSED